MSKDTFYFSHDYNARNDDKILELRSQFGAEGYGVFWMIIETMAENENGGLKTSLIGGLSLGYGVAKARLYEIIELCKSVGLFYEKDEMLFSKRLLNHKYIRKSLSDAGRSGAAKRWGGDRGAIADPMPKERKGKERKYKKEDSSMLNNGLEIQKNNENGKQFTNFKAQGAEILIARIDRNIAAKNAQGNAGTENNPE